MGRKVIRSIILIGAIGCLGASINYLYHYLTSSPYFNLTQIEIEGNKYLDKEAVQKFLGLNASVNIFSLDVKGLNQRLVLHPWVRDGVIKRVLPDKILVSIVERDPVALVDLGPKFLVAQDGQILTPLKGTGGLQLPLITGVGEQEGTKARLKKGAELLIALNASPWIATRGIARLDLSQIERPVVFLKAIHTEIRLSFSQLKQNLSYLHAISPFIEREGKGIAYIDLSFRDLVIVKPHI